MSDWRLKTEHELEAKTYNWLVLEAGPFGACKDSKTR